MKTSWWTVGMVTAVAIVAGVTLGGARGVPTRVTHVVFVQRESEPAWAQRLALVDRALGARNLSRAIYEWQEAYGAAIGSRHWEALVAVGDAALRIEALAGRSAKLRADAREAYLSALFRARAQRAPDGVARVVAAFERLGDGEAVERGRQIAREIIGREHEAQARTGDADDRAPRVHFQWP